MFYTVSLVGLLKTQRRNVKVIALWNVQNTIIRPTEMITSTAYNAE